MAQNETQGDLRLLFFAPESRCGQHHVILLLAATSKHRERDGQGKNPRGWPVRGKN